MSDDTSLGMRFTPRNRKEEVLKSALVLVAEYGLTGVTHRAIAEHASIPLGSTTYYFKKIEDIHFAAFKLFQEHTQNNTERLLESGLEYLKSHVRKESGSIEKLVAAHIEYLESLVGEQLPLRKIEAAFLHAAIVSPEFGELLSARHASFVEKSKSWFELVGVENPDASANTYVGLMNHLERCNTLIGSTLSGRDNIKNTLTYFFSTTLKA